jgi:glutathione peroxidase
MKIFFTLAIAAVLSFSTGKTAHDFTIKTIDGKDKKLSDFKGKKILVVNTASKCGYTPQYEDLEKLHKEYGSKLVIIGFPANNFGKQEPGSNSEIQEFCKKNYGVSFLMAEKVSVKGDDIHPFFQWLTTQENPDFTGDIKWNFEKILIDENGKVIRRFRSGTKPLSKDLTAAI